MNLLPSDSNHLVVFRDKNVLVLSNMALKHVELVPIFVYVGTLPQHE